MQEPAINIVIQQAQNGDIEAFEQLQNKFEGRIRRFISRMIANSDDVDDIVQQTFLALYMNLYRMNPPEKLRPFLFRVARNLCYDNLRKAYRCNDLSLGDCEFRLKSDLPAPEETSHWRLMLDDVRDAIDCLPAIHRDTLILYVEEGLSQSEIAEIMHTEIGTVKSRLHHARKMLRQIVPSDIILSLRHTR